MCKPRGRRVECYYCEMDGFLTLEQEALIENSGDHVVVCGKNLWCQISDDVPIEDWGWDAFDKLTGDLTLYAERLD